MGVRRCRTARRSRPARRSCTTYLTAYIPLHQQVRVRRAPTVLVHAGSGGVGSAAIQLAKQLGRARDRDREHARRSARSRAAGADEAVGYDEIDDLRVDVVIDPVGGDVFTRSLPLLKPLGSIVAIGFTGGLWEDPSVPWLVGRNAGVQGVYLGRLMQARARRSCAAASRSCSRCGRRADRARSSARRSRSRSAATRTR